MKKFAKTWKTSSCKYNVFFFFFLFSLLREHVVWEKTWRWLLAAKKLKEGRWPELYFCSEWFPLNLRGANGKGLNSNMCAGTIYPFVSHPGRSSLKRENVERNGPFLVKQCMGTFFDAVKTSGSVLNSMLDHFILLALSQADVDFIWSHNGFNSQQISSWMFQTLGNINATSNIAVGHRETNPHCLSLLQAKKTLNTKRK